MRWMVTSRNASGFVIPRNSMQQFEKLVFEGQEWMLAGTHTVHWDVSVIGREISRPGACPPEVVTCVCACVCVCV